jgi:hypothetical protein
VWIKRRRQGERGRQGERRRQGEQLYYLGHHQLQVKKVSSQKAVLNL